jgi:hypothetical protein
MFHGPSNLANIRALNIATGLCKDNSLNFHKTFIHYCSQVAGLKHKVIDNYLERKVKMIYKNNKTEARHFSSTRLHY